MQFKSDVEAVDALVEKYNTLKNEVAKVIVGQDDIVKSLIICIFSKGHCLLVGVPGLAKTLMVNTLAKALGLSYNRIQFTPDLMPSDIIGTEILDESRKFRFIKGPVFSNVILADEINRTPPKTQSALLEAMQEKAVTAAGNTYKLDDHFLCWQPKTLLSRKAPTRCPKPSSTGSCSMCGLIIPLLTKK